MDEETRIVLLEREVELLKDQHLELDRRITQWRAESRSQHQDVMDAIARLQSQRERSKGEREGAAQATATMWKRIGIVSAIAASLVALGWLGESEAYPDVGVARDPSKNEIRIRRGPWLTF